MAVVDLNSKRLDIMIIYQCEVNTKLQCVVVCQIPVEGVSASVVNTVRTPTPTLTYGDFNKI